MQGKFRKKEELLIIKAMFAAKEKGLEAKVIHHKLIINNQVFDISTIPVEFRPTVA